MLISRHSIYALFTLLLFIPLKGYGQSVEALKQQLHNNRKSDLEKIRIYLEIADAFISVHPDSVVYYNDKASTLLDKISNQGKIGEEEQIHIKADILANYGVAASFHGELLDALKFHSQAKELWEKAPQKEGLGICYNNIAAIYKQAGDLVQAEDYFKQSLSLLEKAGNKEKVAMVHNNLANLYKQDGKDSKALQHFLISKKLRENSSDRNGLAATLNNIGTLYLKLNKLDSAQIVLNQALAITDSTKNIRGGAYIHKNLAEYYLAQKDYVKAESHAEQALDMSRSINGGTSLPKIYAVLAETYAAQSKFKEAYDMQTLHTQSISELDIERLNRDLIRNEFEFNFEKERIAEQKVNDAKLAQAEKQKLVQTAVLTSVSILAAIVFFFLVLFYKRYKLAQKQKEIIEKQNNERKSLLQEIHHRVKNNFQIMSSMLRLQAHSVKSKTAAIALQDAINRVHAMSSVHEIIYKQDAFAEMNIKKYVDGLVDNIMRTFPNKRVTVNTKVTKEKLTIEQSVPLGVIINELITNSFKHAFPEEIDNPVVEIDLNLIFDKFFLIYKDNGIGMSKVDKEESFGTDLIQTMVEQLNGYIDFKPDTEWKTVYTIQFEALK